MSPVSGAVSCQSSVLLLAPWGSCHRLGSQGHLGQRAIPTEAVAERGQTWQTPVPGGGTSAPGSGLGPSLQGCAEWSGAPHPCPQAQPCLQSPSQRPRGGQPLTLPPVSDPPPGCPAPPCPVPTSGPASGLPSAHPQPKLGVWGWSVRLSPPADAGRGLCCLSSPWPTGGSRVSRPARGGPSLLTHRWVLQTTQELGLSACLPWIVHLPAASSLGSRRTGVTEHPGWSSCPPSCEFASLIRDTQQTEKTIRWQLGPAGKCRLS